MNRLHHHCGHLGPEAINQALYDLVADLDLLDLAIIVPQLCRLHYSILDSQFPHLPRVLGSLYHQSLNSRVDHTELLDDSVEWMHRNRPRGHALLLFLLLLRFQIDRQ